MRKLTTFEAAVKHETEMAVLIESAETGNEDWVPKSVIEVYEDDGKVTMPEDMAIEKGLI